ncbi:MAG: Mycofactocin system glycosyltransferase, partial [Aeromicrobium sp.]|nr:Mycofactocin system glycosyltransferase [Aeromicrobium sp.]
MPADQFTLDSSYRRPRDGHTVIAGSPLRLFTLSDAGVRVVQAIEHGRPLPANHRRLTDRLVDAGAVHPQPDASAEVDLAAGVTVVVPAFGALPIIGPMPCRTIIIDDASQPPLPSADGAYEIHRLEANQGPGAARNAGLALVDTELVAFVDTDVQIDVAELTELLRHFTDPRVALVAPRIRPMDAPGALAAFEHRHSPLDRGAQAGRVAPTTRVSFVPAAVIVCRTAAVRAVGGFDASLRFGEDVDLVWRLVAAGHRCRYEPSAVAQHRVRPDLASWLRQRVGYGSSAAPLAERHPGALAPFRMSGWSAASWTAIAAGFPIVGSTIGVGTALALARKLRSIPAAESLRLAGRGNLFAGRLVAGALTRAWWPVALLLALFSHRARRALALAVLVP